MTAGNTASSKGYNSADLDAALNGTFESRKESLFRLLADVYNRGWSDCEETAAYALQSLDPTRHRDTRSPEGMRAP